MLYTRRSARCGCHCCFQGKKQSGPQCSNKVVCTLVTVARWPQHTESKGVRSLNDTGRLGKHTERRRNGTGLCIDCKAKSRFLVLLVGHGCDEMGGGH